MFALTFVCYAKDNKKVLCVNGVYGLHDDQADWLIEIPASCSSALLQCSKGLNGF